MEKWSVWAIPNGIPHCDGKYTSLSEHVTQLEKDPERVMSYFQIPFAKYAAGS